MPVKLTGEMRQVTGVDDLFNERLRLVVEYMQFRELSADLKRKVL
jgi:hypothetical protein